MVGISCVLRNVVNSLGQLLVLNLVEFVFKVVEENVALIAANNQQVLILVAREDSWLEVGVQSWVMVLSDSLAIGPLRVVNLHIVCPSSSKQKCFFLISKSVKLQKR